jgi:hypothetical protein
MAPPKPAPAAPQAACNLQFVDEGEALAAFLLHAPLADRSLVAHLIEQRLITYSYHILAVGGNCQDR